MSGNRTDGDFYEIECPHCTKMIRDLWDGSAHSIGDEVECDHCHGLSVIEDYRAEITLRTKPKENTAMSDAADTDKSSQQKLEMQTLVRVEAFVAAYEDVGAGDVFSSAFPHDPDSWKARVWSLRNSTVISATGPTRHDAIMALPAECERYWETRKERVESALTALREGQGRSERNGTTETRDGD